MEIKYKTKADLKRQIEKREIKALSLNATEDDMLTYCSAVGIKASRLKVDKQGVA